MVVEELDLGNIEVAYVDIENFDLDKVVEGMLAGGMLAEDMIVEEILVDSFEGNFGMDNLDTFEFEGNSSLACPLDLKVKGGNCKDTSSVMDKIGLE